jgi:hypothetical protein
MRFDSVTITKRDEKMRSLGLISDDEKDVRFPFSDSRPNHPAGFSVMFSAFLFWGLSLPAHEFSSVPLVFVRYSALAVDAEFDSAPHNFYHRLRRFPRY